MKHTESNPITTGGIPHTIRNACADCERLRARVAGLEAKLALLQQQQHDRPFREPERTIVCDIIANGCLLPDRARYSLERDAALQAAGRLAQYASDVIADAESDYEDCPDDFSEKCPEIWASLKADIATVRAALPKQQQKETNT